MLFVSRSLKQCEKNMYFLSRKLGFILSYKTETGAPMSSEFQSAAVPAHGSSCLPLTMQEQKPGV